MAFEVSADSYARFMGRYSAPLSGVFLAWIGSPRQGRALDVGCGPGALTHVLAGMLGGKNVAAVDPSDIFVHAVRQRLPEVDVRLARAEELPYPDRSFDWVLAQLVVHFMRDPIRGLAEMARVCAPGGVVAATVWDHAGGGGPLTAFWQAVHSMDASVGGEADLAGAHEGHLAELFAQAGMHNVRATALTVNVTHESFEEWWEPYTLGVGPAGDHVVGLDTAQRAELRDRCQALLPSAPFTLTAKAWTVAWSAPAG